MLCSQVVLQIPINVSKHAASEDAPMSLLFTFDDTKKGTNQFMERNHFEHQPPGCEISCQTILNNQEVNKGS